MPDYANQRQAKTPPHISLGDLRAVSGLTLEEVCQTASEFLGKPVTRGALSAIENGHRGASSQMLAALEFAYGLRKGALVTNYQPRGTAAA